MYGHPQSQAGPGRRFQRPAYTDYVEIYHRRERRKDRRATAIAGFAAVFTGGACLAQGVLRGVLF